MTDAEKEMIRFLRMEGLGYGAVAERLGLSENTVKSYCRRNHLTGVAAKERAKVCRECVVPLASVPGRKGRKFCCGGCRRDCCGHRCGRIRSWYTGRRIMCCPADIAGGSLKAMGIGGGNIVAMNAISGSGSGKGEVRMTAEQFEREKKYQAAVAVARSMLEKGVIDEQDFLRVEEKMREKFRPVLGGFLL